MTTLDQLQKYKSTFHIQKQTSRYDQKDKVDAGDLSFPLDRQLSWCLIHMLMRKWQLEKYMLKFGGVRYITRALLK